MSFPCANATLYPGPRPCQTLSFTVDGLEKHQQLDHRAWVKDTLCVNKTTQLMSLARAQICYRLLQAWSGRQAIDLHYRIPSRVTPTRQHRIASSLRGAGPRTVWEQQTTKSKPRKVNQKVKIHHTQRQITEGVRVGKRTSLPFSFIIKTLVPCMRFWQSDYWAYTPEMSSTDNTPVPTVLKIRPPEQNSTPEMSSTEKL
jgi:hypothetical protein